MCLSALAYQRAQHTTARTAKCERAYVIAVELVRPRAGSCAALRAGSADAASSGRWTPRAAVLAGHGEGEHQARHWDSSDLASLEDLSCCSAGKQRATATPSPPGPSARLQKGGPSSLSSGGIWPGKAELMAQMHAGLLLTACRACSMLQLWPTQSLTSPALLAEALAQRTSLMIYGSGGSPLPPCLHALACPGSPADARRPCGCRRGWHIVTRACCTLRRNGRHVAQQPAACSLPGAQPASHALP